MNFDELLRNLRRDYLNSLPQKILDIRTQIQSGSAVDLQDAFHKLKGTGKTYGIPEISELAAEIEAICHTRPTEATCAATQAVLILQDIHQARNANSQYNLADDPRFRQIRGLKS